MVVVTTANQGQVVEIPQYEHFVVEIPSNPSTGVMVSGPFFQGFPNAVVLSNFFVPEAVGVVGAPGRMVYLMMSTVPGTSAVYWFMSGPNTVSDFNFALAVARA